MLLLSLLVLSVVRVTSSCRFTFPCWLSSRHWCTATGLYSEEKLTMSWSTLSTIIAYIHQHQHALTISLMILCLVCDNLMTMSWLNSEEILTMSWSVLSHCCAKEEDDDSRVSFCDSMMAAWFCLMMEVTVKRDSMLKSKTDQQEKSENAVESPTTETQPQ